MYCEQVTLFLFMRVEFSITPSVPFESNPFKAERRVLSILWISNLWLLYMFHVYG